MAVRSLLGPVGTALSLIMQMIEAPLYMFVRFYDAYIYTPLQVTLSPVVYHVPRTVTIDGQTVNIFTANIVTFARTLLVVPIAFTLKYGFHWTGFWLVVLHDFLDHLDGIVAKVHRQKYGEVDDPVLGGFLDAQCDKIVNVLALWSCLMVTDFSSLTWTETTIYAGACAIIIAYEFVLGIVRIQDYYRAHYFRKFKKTDTSSVKSSTAAVMAGKAKEKLESVGIAAMCVSQASPNVMNSIAGVIGVSCLCLSVRLAHSSLMSKMNARAPQIRSEAHASDDEDEMKNSHMGEKNNSVIQTNFCGGKTDNDMKESDPSSDQESKIKSDEKQVEERDSPSQGPVRSLSLPGTAMLNDACLDTRAERVYTVGCFDLFHHGHVKLIKQMRTFGKKVIVGVHDSRSIYQLKKRVPIDSTVTRMKNVKQFADEVFCVAGTDPTPFIDLIFDKKNDKSSAIYIRGDDMPHFPARHLCEKLMTVKFLPYTEGVSTTKLRKDLFNSNYGDITLHEGLGDIMLY